MNFVNARHPGGGFLYGANGQEEDLCRASTLYASISSASAKGMYVFNRKSRSPVDSDYMLISPTAYVFRDAAGNFLNEPFRISVITVPAPDKLCRAVNVPQAELDETVKNRLRNMLRVAVRHGYRVLILGAWGCGAFANDSKDIARCFRYVLVTERYGSYFDDIIFAIPDESKRHTFEECFQKALFQKEPDQ